jgi:Methyltransferase domain
MDRVKIWVRLRLEDINNAINRLARRVLKKMIDIVLNDLEVQSRLSNPTPALAFAREHLSKAESFKSRQDLHRWAIMQIPDRSGLFLEFGVRKGDSINRLAGMLPEVRLYGFDSFFGLPEAWGAMGKAGVMSVEGRVPPVRPNVTIVKGLFDDTLPGFLAEHPEKHVSFLHIDCDLYSSTRTVLRHLAPRLRPGTVIIFDELYNYPGWEQDEYKAFMEYVAENNIAFDYIGYVRVDKQVAVRLR